MSASFSATKGTGYEAEDMTYSFLFSQLLSNVMMKIIRISLLPTTRSNGSERHE